MENLKPLQRLIRAIENELYIKGLEQMAKADKSVSLYDLGYIVALKNVLEKAMKM